MRKVIFFAVIEPDSDRVYVMQSMSEEYAKNIKKGTEVFEMEAYLPPKEIPLAAQPNFKGTANAKVRKLR